MTIAVVIPARNESAVIGKMVRMILALYSSHVTQIIVVNDNSEDDTAAIVSSLALLDRRVVLVNRKPPSGVGRAIREGLRHVGKSIDYIWTLDADFIRNIPDMADFIAHLNGCDGIIGSRYLERHSLIHYPLLKRLCNRTFHFFTRVFLGIPHSDLTNNFKLYKRDVFTSLPLSADDFSINAETGLYPLLAGYTIHELPVIWFARNRQMGRSKFHLFRVAPGYIRVLLRAITLSRRSAKQTGRQRA